MKKKEIYTIGHSTLPIEKFIYVLKSNNIDLLLDIRSLPGSKANPQFNKENLEKTLKASGIGYIWLKDLGGRRYGLGKKSPNICWKNASFRGYADYMMTKEFADGIATLEEETRRHTTAMMCAESLYWRCHRWMVSDYLKSKGYKVIHIVGTGKLYPHNYSECAKIRKGRLSYF